MRILLMQKIALNTFVVSLILNINPPQTFAMKKRWVKKIVNEKNSFYVQQILDFYFCFI